VVVLSIAPEFGLPDSFYCSGRVDAARSATHLMPGTGLLASLLHYVPAPRMYRQVLPREVRCRHRARFAP
jgi:hypothetical protein